MFHTQLGADTLEDEGRGFNDEANTAGVRVECLNIDGSEPTGTPTIEIVDSGTHNARCILTHPDGTSTEWRFVSPSADTNTSNGYGAQDSAAAGSMNQNIAPLTPHKNSAGPYPVYATLQDFIDWMDGLANSWDKLAFDTYWAATTGMAVEQATKSAWLPQGLKGDTSVGGTIASSSAWPAANLDPRIDLAHNNPLPNIGLYIATMFQPLLYDNNQLSYETAGVSNDIVRGVWTEARPAESGIGDSGTYFNFFDEGMTRHNQQPQTDTVYPQTETVSGARFKWFKSSGDFKEGQVGSFQKVDTVRNPDNLWDYVNWDIDPSSSAYGGPSYRMRTALACFLKDGTYTLSGGSLIPYIYDPARTIGGSDGTTCYAVWNGKGGVANTQAELDTPTTSRSQSAQIFPLFDFIQGPLCPAGQGWNYDYDVVQYKWFPAYIEWNSQQNDAYINGATGDGGSSPNTLSSPVAATLQQQPRSCLVRPNPTRAPIYAVGQASGDGSGNPHTTSGTATGTLTVWVEDNNTEVGKANKWKAGMPIYMEMDGVLNGLRAADGTLMYQWQQGPNSREYGMEWDADTWMSVVLGGGATDTLGGYSSRSGWWIITAVDALASVAKSTIVSGAVGTFTGHKLTFTINTGYSISLPDPPSSKSNSIQDITTYACAKGFVCQGIMGGAEFSWGGYNYWDGSASVNDTDIGNGGTWPYDPISGFYAGSGTAVGRDRDRSASYSPNKYNIFTTQGPIYDAEMGVGFIGGAYIGGQNVPAYGGHNFTSPTRLTLDPLALWSNDMGGWFGDYANTPAGISLQSPTQDVFISNPIAGGHGGGMLRCNAPNSFGHAGQYFSITNVDRLSSSGMELVADMGWSNFSVGHNAVYEMSQTDPANVLSKNASKFSYNSQSAGWFSKGMTILFTSFYDQATGYHAWDYCPAGTGVEKWPYGRNRIWPVHERVATKGGYGSFGQTSWTLLEPNPTVVGDRTYGMETTNTGLTEVGCSPIWLDLQIKAWWPVQKDLLTIIDFDTGVNNIQFGRHAHNNHGSMLTWTQGFTRIGLIEGLNDEVSWGTGEGSATDLGWKSMNIQNESQTKLASHNSQIFVWGGSAMWGEPPAFNYNQADVSLGGDWVDVALENSWPYAAMGGNNVGWGTMGNYIGTGTPFTMTEGYHTMRATFDEEGMTMSIDGASKGKDLNSNDPVWGFSLLFQKSCGQGLKSNASPLHDGVGNDMWMANPTYNKTNAAFQMDEITIRHIPSDAMIPFPVDSRKQQIAGVGKYTGLSVEVDNINVSKGMNVKVSICPVNDNIATDLTVLRQGEGGTPYENFDALDLNVIGGFGSIDLTTLPTDATTNGFVIRFLFYVPTSSMATLQPVDWSTTPIIRSWSLEYDIKPTASIACIGNTFNGDITPPIDTKVGHIVSFRGTGITTDIDRIITQVKFDFGDGVITDWLPFTDQTLQTNTYDTAHSYLIAGTYDAKVYSKDDAGNESDAATMSVVVVNSAPVAVLRAVPSLIRAGQPITLDGTDSFDINAGASLSSYTFTYGDGSGSTTNASGTAQHTYAAAGEYQATLVVVDNDSASSQTATAIIKVLPATLVVPLVFNIMPKGFQRNRSAEWSQTPVLDAVYPELTDMGQRHDEFALSGSFLTETANADIEFVEELLMSGSLVEFMWESVNYVGTPTGKTFVGRITSFDYNREGGRHGETPYTINLVREAGLGV